MLDNFDYIHTNQSHHRGFKIQGLGSVKIQQFVLLPRITSVGLELWLLEFTFI